MPEDSGWNVVQLVCGPERWLESGWFVQHVDLCDGFPPPGGKEGTYVRSLAEFVGTASFFVEWRMHTDGVRTELPWGGPSNFSPGSFGEVRYNFSISSDRADMNRDNTLPIPVVDYDSEIIHTHRLELYGSTLYLWLIDGTVVDSGAPEGAYPSTNPSLTWRSKSAFLPNTTKWDYIRYGNRPQDSSGDFDSDGDHDLRDFYFFHECIERPHWPEFVASIPNGSADPGCLWADLNGDGLVNLHDFADFQILASDLQ